MNVALISYEYPTETNFGGIATYVQQAASLLAQRGHHVEVFTATRNHDRQQQEGATLVNYIKAATHAEFRAKVQEVFTQRHQSCAFDLIEGPDYGADGYFIRQQYPEIAHVVRLHTSLRLVNSLDVVPAQLAGWWRHKWMTLREAVRCLKKGNRPPTYEPYRPHIPRYSPLEEIEREYTLSSDFVSATSHAIKAWSIREWSLSPSKCQVIPNFYTPSEAMLRINIAEKATHEGATNGQTVGLFGRLQHLKGTDDFVAAIPLILQAEPTTRFHFVGRATRHRGSHQPYDKYIRQQLKAYPHAFDLVGGEPLERMPTHYAAVDISVVPSWFDAFPYVCLEAMAAGRPIVATNSGGLPEMIEHDKTGLIVLPHQPKMIADAVIRLIRNPALRSTLGANARQKVLHAYSNEKIAPLIESSYYQAIEIAKARNQSSATLTGHLPAGL